MKEFEKEFKKYDLLLFDTAGRDALNDELIQELKLVNKLIQPQEVLLVMAADVGQAAEKQAQTFHDTCGVTGVIITKLDGTAKGGGALSACAITGAKVRFIGIGEKVDDFEEFDPKRFVGKLLGMGDLETLLEKAKEAMSEEDAQDLSKKLLKGDFTLIDLYTQMEAMNKMGPLNKIMEMIPGFGQIKMPKEALQVQQEKLKKWNFIMSSMTKKELEEPEEITGKQVERIAKGSGTSVTEVRDLLKQYKQSKKMIKAMKGGKNMEKMMKRMGGKMPGM
jgi:signal recognition particle subunit SRP54